MKEPCGTFYVNSFPRSGNTWVRGLLRDLLDPVPVDANPIFSRLFGVIPWCRFPAIRVRTDRCRWTMIKSHGRYETTIAGIPIIYLVRDGRDSLLSYYHFNVAHRGYSEDFTSYFDRHVCRDEMNSRRERVLRQFMGDWSENSLSYADRPNVLLIRYEDLIRDPAAGVTEMLGFVGATVRADLIEQSIENGRQKLTDKNRRHDRARGVSGTWRERLTAEQQKQFVSRHRTALETYGYGASLT